MENFLKNPNAKKTKALTTMFLIISIAFVFVFTFQPAYSSSFNFNSKINISNTGFGPSTDAQMITSGNNIYLIWTDQTAGSGSNADIFFVNSTNGGTTFFPPKNLSNDPGSSEFPQMATSGNHVYAAWQDDASGVGRFDILFTNSTNGGHDFSAVSNLTKGIGASANVHVVASGGKVYLIWQNAFGSNNIFFLNGTDSGSGVKFTDPSKNISNVGSDIATNPQLAISGNHVYAIWQESDHTGKNDILFTNSTDGGRTFSQPLNLTKNSGDSTNPQLAVSGSNVYVVWQDDTGSGPNIPDVLFLKGSDNGTASGVTFSNPIKNLSNNAGVSEFPQIAVSGDNVYVVWDDFTPNPSASDIFFSRSTDDGLDFNTATSGVPINISSNSGISTSQKIFADSSNVYITWQDTTATTLNDVFFKASVDNGATFGGFNRISDISSSGLPNAEVVSSSNNNVYVAWSSDNNGLGHGDIYFRSGSSSPSSPDITFDRSQYRLSEQAAIRIISPASNSSSVDVITANVTSTSDPPPNGISPTLTETSATSANFTGLIHFHSTASDTSNSTLKAAPGDTITASFGGETGTAFIFPRTVTFDFSFYTLDKNATVRVIDQNSNNPALIDTITPVNVKSTSDPVGINLSITESSADAGGVFSKKIGFTNDTSHGTQLHALVGDTITATFLGKTGTASISPGVNRGGGGGGLIRPGLVLDAIGGQNIPPDLLALIQSLDPSKTIMPSTDPTIPFPFSIDGKGYPLSSYSNKILTNEVKTGQHVPLDVIIFSSLNIAHIGLYFNIHGDSSELQDSDTYILYDDGQPLTIIDPHGYFSGVNMTSSSTGLEHKFNYDIIFAKPMSKSDIIERVWDVQRHTADTKILDALEVVQSEKNETKNPVTQPKPELTKESSVDILSDIKKWGGYSPESIHDSTLLKDMGVNGQHIPLWVMKTTKWVVDGDISQQEFVNIIKYLDEKGIIQ